MTLDNVDIKKFKPIIGDFDVIKFNSLNDDERKRLVVNFSNLLCETFGFKILEDAFEFLPEEDMGVMRAGYNWRTKHVLIKDNIFNGDNIPKKVISREDIFELLKNIIHETTHYIQDTMGLYQEAFETPFQDMPFYVFEDHEYDAHESTMNVLTKMEQLFEPDAASDFLSSVTKLRMAIDNTRRAAKILIGNHGYEIGTADIREQIKKIRPFYKDYYRFANLINNDKFDKSLIIENNTEILLVHDDANWHVHIGLNDDGVVNNLYCNIGKICKINMINKTENNSIYPVDKNIKNDLMVILNKVINVYNKRHRGYECESIEIVPVSINDNRVEYEKFLAKKHEIKPIKFDISSRLISLKTIDENCPFDTIDYNLKKEQKDMNESYKTDEHNLNTPDNIR